MVKEQRQRSVAPDTSNPLSKGYHGIQCGDRNVEQDGLIEGPLWVLEERPRRGVATMPSVEYLVHRWGTLVPRRAIRHPYEKGGRLAGLDS
jgi:hypothetical protein